MWNRTCLPFRNTRAHSRFSKGFVARSSVLCITFCRSLSVFLFFSLGHCVACPTSIYSFWLPLLVSANLSVFLLNRDDNYRKSVENLVWYLTPLSTIFQIYRDVQYLGEGNREYQGKLSTCRKSLTNLYQRHLATRLHWIKLTTLAVIWQV